MPILDRGKIVDAKIKEVASSSWPFRVSVKYANEGWVEADRFTNLRDAKRFLEEIYNYQFY